MPPSPAATGVVGMDSQADADLLGHREDGFQEDTVVVPHPLGVDRPGERAVRGELVAGQRVALGHEIRIEGGHQGPAPAPRPQVGPPDVGRHEVMAEHRDPGPGHVADRRPVVLELLLAPGLAQQHLVPVAEGHVLDALDDQAGGLAALAKVDQLVQLPVTELVAEVGWRVELDARQAELLGEGGDRVVEPLDVPEGQAHAHRSVSPRADAPAGRGRSISYHEPSIGPSSKRRAAMIATTGAHCRLPGSRLRCGRAAHNVATDCRTASRGWADDGAGGPFAFRRARLARRLGKGTT